jgi:hypothetical protein
MTTTGILKNLSTTLKGADYKGRDAVVEYSNLFNDFVSKCVLPDGEVFDSGWIDNNVLNGVVNLNIIFDCDLSEAYWACQLLIYRRDPDSSDKEGTLFATPQNLVYFPDESPVYGNNVTGYFLGNYGYRIVLKVLDGFTGSYLSFNLLRILHESSKEVISDFYNPLLLTSTTFPVRKVKSGTLEVILDSGYGEDIINLDGSPMTFFCKSGEFSLAPVGASFIPFVKVPYIYDANGYITTVTIAVDDSMGNCGDLAVVDWIFIGDCEIPIF